jgi:hypothetical protein
MSRYVTFSWLCITLRLFKDRDDTQQDLTAMVHTIIRTAIGQYYVRQAVTRGVPRDQIQPGSVTFIQRFGSALNLMKPSQYPSFFSG